LAIGKKGQNVRLAAKLLGWKIDIKSEEEKRQEVESAMAALVAPGAPVSALIDYGLPEQIADTLLQAGIGTIEKLGSMTPEDLEAVPGVGGEVIEKLQEAVNAYYGQYDAVAAGEQPPQETAGGPVEQPAESPVETPPDSAPEAESAPDSAEQIEGTSSETAATDFDTMKDSPAGT